MDVQRLYEMSYRSPRSNLDLFSCALIIERASRRRTQHPGNVTKGELEILQAPTYMPIFRIGEMDELISAASKERADHLAGKLRGDRSTGIIRTWALQNGEEVRNNINRLQVLQFECPSH